MKIPLKEIINSGAWLTCITKGWSDQVISFKMKIISFEKISSDRIDIKKLGLDDGILWLLNIEVVNLEKEEIEPYHVSTQTVLLDQDDYKFNTIAGSALSQTRFAERTGIRRFCGDNAKLKSKIKANGALPFLIPDEESSEYYLSVEGGNIREV